MEFLSFLVNSPLMLFVTLYLPLLPFMLLPFLHITVLCLSYITIKLSYQMNERKRRKRRELKERRKIYFPSFTFSFLDGLLLFFVLYTSYFFHCLFFIISSAFYNFLPLKQKKIEIGAKSKKKQTNT